MSIWTHLAIVGSVGLSLATTAWAEGEGLPASEASSPDTQTPTPRYMSLDELTLHYMQSRGIDYQTAQSMLIKGFFRPLIALIENQSIKKIAQTI